MKIKAVILGSTGMIGQGVLQECIAHPEIESILLLNRKSAGIKHQKVKEILHNDFFNLTPLISELSNYNTCYFSLGVSSLGLSEDEYYKITYELTVSVAETLLKANTSFAFCYISGAGTDSTEKGSTMWARVKGKLENKLLSMPFKKIFMLRPGYIQPMKGIKSKTAWYNFFYTLFKPLYFILKIFKGLVTDTTTLAKAMINVSIYGYEKSILESTDINKAGKKV